MKYDTMTVKYRKTSLSLRIFYRIEETRRLMGCWGYGVSVMDRDVRLLNYSLGAEGTKGEKNARNGPSPNQISECSGTHINHTGTELPWSVLGNSHPPASNQITRGQDSARCRFTLHSGRVISTESISHCGSDDG